MNRYLFRAAAVLDDSKGEDSSDDLEGKSIATLSSVTWMSVNMVRVLLPSSAESGPRAGSVDASLARPPGKVGESISVDMAALM